MWKYLETRLSSQADMHKEAENAKDHSLIQQSTQEVVVLMASEYIETCTAYLSAIRRSQYQPPTLNYCASHKYSPHALPLNSVKQTYSKIKQMHKMKQNVNA